ncbi:MAG: hypothetical protein AAGF58_02975 [Pseudomonadota bacterium]
MIISRSALILIFACAGVSIGVVAISQKTLALQRELAQINRQIDKEKQLIEVLESEWALFTSPTSLYAKLEDVWRKGGRERHPSLDLNPLTRAQIFDTVGMVPVSKPRWVDETDTSPLMATLEGGRSFPIPPVKPETALRPAAQAMLAAVNGSAATTVEPPKPAVIAVDAAQPVQSETEEPGDAIGDLLRHIDLAKDALAEVASE